MSSNVASLTLAHSHSQPLTTMVRAWKFFCLGRGIIWTLYWSMMARMYGLLVSGTDWKLGIIGKSKLNRSGVNSLTLALARSTPPISPAIDTLKRFHDQ